MQRLNQNLVEELSCTFDELDALKRTVLESHSLVISTEPSSKARSVQQPALAGEEDFLVVPSFLRVMQAEQTLHDNYIFDEPETATQAHLQQRLRMGSCMKGFDESSEADVDPENSIPQESSISANVSFQNQRRATGTLNAQNQRNGGTTGIVRGKSTPALQSSGNVVNNSSSSN